MRYHVTKLDARYSYSQDFKYMLEFSKDSWLGTGVLNFDRSRRWFNQTFGWSQDVETRSAIIRHAVKSDDPDAYNLCWAYSAKYREYRIYIADEAVLNWFVLSHPNAA
jgi:hypothetical protein